MTTSCFHVIIIQVWVDPLHEVAPLGAFSLVRYKTLVIQRLYMTTRWSLPRQVIDMNRFQHALIKSKILFLSEAAKRRCLSKALPARVSQSVVSSNPPIVYRSAVSIPKTLFISVHPLEILSHIL